MMNFIKTKLKDQGMGSALLDLEFDFKAARERDKEEAEKGQAYSKNAYVGGWEMDLAEALKSTLQAANDIGWIEHTCDWDPYLIIKLRDGRILNTPSHYYLVQEIVEFESGVYYLLIEAPDKETLENYDEADTGEIMEFYSMEDGDPVFKFRLSDIDYVSVDPQ